MKLIFAATAALLASHALAQPLFTVTDLGRLPGYTYSTVPMDINNRGEVVGLAMNGATYQAFIWDAARGMRALPPVPGESTRSSTALGINDLGEIIGYSGQSGGSHSVGWLYRNGQYTMLGTLPGYDGCLPASINNNTEIVGSATGLDGLSPNTNFYWSPSTGMLNVVPGAETELYGINDAGVVCGGVRSGALVPPGIMTWDMRSHTVADLGMLPDCQLSFGYDINESGQVAGTSIYISTGGHREAHPITVSPSLPLVDLGIAQAAALSINERGEMIGTRPFASNSTYYSWLFSPQRGLILNLQTVVQDAPYFGRISSARAINDQGQIIATGDNGHFPADLSRRGFVLNPILACPAITTHPHDQSACLNQALSLTTGAEGTPPLSFQWLRDGLPIDATINPTAATNTLRIHTPHADDRGTYRCVVSNACGEITSNPAIITLCFGDFNCDSAVDGDDTIAFFVAWDSGNNSADINNDGGTDSDDIIAFFGAGDAGC